MANLAAGTGDAEAAGFLPRNTAGGQLGITGDATLRPIVGLRSSYFACSDRILGQLARQLDRTMDDGDTATGFMQSTAAGTGHDGTAEGSPADGTPYLVCMGF